MKKQIAITLMMLISAFALKAQTEFKPGGSGIGTVFFNYKYDLTEDVTRASSFNLERAYLGYKYDFTQNLSGRVIFDMAYDPTVKSFTVFAKNAYLDWGLSPHFKLSFGLIPLRHFDYQDKFWGYRYIMKTFTDEYGMGTTADLGVNAEIPVNNILSFNVFAINGEGFRSLQDNFGMHKFGGNVTVKPVEGLSFRVHYDMMGNKYRLADTLPVQDTSTISVFTAFAGYEVKDLFRIGVEYNMMNNAYQFTKYADNRQLSGISIFGTYIINPKWEVFARYDMLTSNTPGGFEDPWNYAPSKPKVTAYTNGSMVMGGMQYKITKGVNVALNYRTYINDNEALTNPSAVYLNLGMGF